MLPNYADVADAPGRNNYISLRMYSIDLQYTDYESHLTQDTQDVDLAATLANLGLTGAASVVPSASTGRILSAAASGVTGAAGAFDKDILLSQAIQNLETQMRTDRNDQAARMFANMNCSIEKYPMGMALADLELYYRAGTLASALVGISRTVNNAEVVSKASKDTENPSPDIKAVGRSQLLAAASASNAQSRVNGGSEGSPAACQR